MNDTRDWKNDTPPERIWLQWYADEEMFECDEEPELNTGLIAAHPEERTYCADEPVNWHDVPYVQTAVHEAEIARLGGIIIDLRDLLSGAARSRYENMEALLNERAVENERLSDIISAMSDKLTDAELAAEEKGDG